MFVCFKQLPLNIKQKTNFLYYSLEGERLLSVVVGAVCFLVDKPLDLHDTTFPYHQVFLKYNKAVEVLTKVVLHHWQSSFNQ